MSLGLFAQIGIVHVKRKRVSVMETTEIDANIKSMWYRFSRREDDYCIECSEDGVTFKQMLVCHMWNGAGAIRLAYFLLYL